MDTADKIILWRRELHRHPEEGWTEFWTTGFVARQLADMGLAPRVGREILDPGLRQGLPAPERMMQARQRALEEGLETSWLERMGPATGVVADIGPADAPLALVLRCDMDALPLAEATDAAHRPVREGFSSRHQGLCHACGHDGHMALGLGLAALLTAPDAAPLRHRVRLLFQPAEEGVRGAAALLEQVAGARAFLAVHIGLGAPRSGALVTGVGGFLATSKFDVRFTGRAAHAGAAPEQGRDALKGAASALLGLHALPRHGHGPSRICVGRLEGGGSRNTVPASAVMACETRGASSEIDAELLQRARAVIEGAAVMHGLDWDFEMVGGAPAAESDAALADLLARCARQLPPDARGGGTFSPALIRSGGHMGASDDATTLMRAVQQQGGQAAYAFLGADLAAGHHQPAFDFDESVLWPGARWLEQACRELAG